MPIGGIPRAESKFIELAHETVIQLGSTANLVNASASSLLSTGLNTSRSATDATVRASHGKEIGDFLNGGMFGEQFTNAMESHVRGLSNYGSSTLSRRFPGALFSEPSVAFVLHLHDVSIQQLRKHASGSMVSFLLNLHDEFSKAQGLEHFHIKVLGINGRYLIQDRRSGPKPHTDNEVLVKFSVAPVEPRPGGQHWIIEALSKRLRASDNALLASPLAFALRNVTIVEASGKSTMVSPRLDGRHAAAQVGPMLLPIAVSAAFTGVLVWLAAL